MSNHPSSPQFWKEQARTLRQVQIQRVSVQGGWVAMATTDGLHFGRHMKDLGRRIEPGDKFGLEVINGWRVTGMQDECGGWLFQETNEQLAAEYCNHTAWWEEI